MLHKNSFKGLLGLSFEKNYGLQHCKRVLCRYMHKRIQTFIKRRIYDNKRLRNIYIKLYTHVIKETA